MSGLRRSSRRSSDPPPPITISTPASDYPIDASSMPLRRLREIIANPKQNQLLLFDLDFVNVADNVIVDLFYGKNRIKSRSLADDGTLLLPPKALRRSYNQIIIFVDRGRVQKIEEIDKYATYEIQTTGLINYTESKYCVPLQNQEDRPSKSTTASQQFTDNDLIPSTCGGINIQYLKDMRYTSERFEEMALGFADTQREALMTRVNLESPRNIFGGWNYDTHVVGALVSGSDKNRVEWTCIDVGDGNADPFQLGADINFGRYTFRHVDCNDSDGKVSNGLCTACLKAKPLLLNRIDSNPRLHINEFHPKRKVEFDRTPSLMQKRTLYYSQRVKQISRRLSYKAKALEKLMEDTGVECPINEVDNLVGILGVEYCW